jgi:hypothetical protein
MADTSIRDSSTAPLTGKAVCPQCPCYRCQLTRAQFDLPLIHEYATRIYYTRFHKMMAADPIAMPDHVELWTVSLQLSAPIKSSLTHVLAHHSRSRNEVRQLHDSPELENMIRASNDPEQGFFFLKNLPGTVLRDMMASAEVEIERKEEKKDDITRLLGQTLDTNIKTANATLRLLRRFEAAKDPDPDVVYVKEMVTASRKAMVEKQQALRAAGILKE